MSLLIISELCMGYARMVVFDSSDAIKAFVEVVRHSACVSPIQFLLADARSKVLMSLLRILQSSSQEDPKVPAIIGYFDKDLHAHEKDVFEDVRDHCDMRRDMSSQITFFLLYSTTCFPNYVYLYHAYVINMIAITTAQVADLEFGNYKIAHTTNKQVLKEAGVDGFAIYVYKPVSITLTTSLSCRCCCTSRHDVAAWLSSHHCLCVLCVLTSLLFTFHNI
jgi:hypothetical protein